MFQVENFNNKNLTLLIFLISLFFALLISFLVNLFLIPVIYNNESIVNEVGNTLINLDSVYYHKKATMMVNSLLENNLSILDMLLENPFITFVTALIYYCFEPNSIYILPFNAIIHGLTSCIIFLILRCFFSKSASFYSTFLFICHPQSVEWYSQILKDGMFILGMSLFFLYILWTLKFIKNSLSNKILYLYITSIIGLCLVYFNRGQMLYYCSIAQFLLLTFILYVFFKEKNSNRDSYKYLLNCTIVLSFIFILLNYGITTENYNSQTFDLMTLQVKPGEFGESFFEMKRNIHKLNFLPVWEDNIFIPDQLEKFMYRINLFRFYSLRLDANTNFNSEIFINAYQFLLYFPKSIYFSLFSPLPQFWIDASGSTTMFYAKIVIGLTSIVSYILIFCFLFYFYSNIKNSNLLLIVIILFIALSLVGYLCVNTGTLLRYRFIYFILINCFGLSFLIEHLKKKYK